MEAWEAQLAAIQARSELRFLAMEARLELRFAELRSELRFAELTQLLRQLLQPQHQLAHEQPRDSTTGDFVLTITANQNESDEVAPVTIQPHDDEFKVAAKPEQLDGVEGDVTDSDDDAIKSAVNKEDIAEVGLVMHSKAVVLVNDHENIPPPANQIGLVPHCFVDPFVASNSLVASNSRRFEIAVRPFGFRRVSCPVAANFIHFFGKFGKLHDAFKLFVKIPHPIFMSCKSVMLEFALLYLLHSCLGWKMKSKKSWCCSGPRLWLKCRYSRGGVWGVNDELLLDVFGSTIVVRNKIDIEETLGCTTTTSSLFKGMYEAIGLRTWMLSIVPCSIVEDTSLQSPNTTPVYIHVSVLHFVDLMKYKHIAKNGADDVRLQEGYYFNKSLMVLENVLNQLNEVVELPQSADVVDATFLDEIATFQHRPFLRANQAMADAHMVDNSCGTTTITALLLGHHLSIADVGDCRAVLCRQDDEFFLIRYDGIWDVMKNLKAEMAISEGTFAKFKDFKGGNALHIAVGTGHTHVCDYWIKQLKFDKDEQDELGETPLHYATTDKRHETVLYLMEYEASISKANHEGLVPLHCAATTGGEELLQLFISRGADIEANSTPVSPLTYAADEAHVEVVAFLLNFRNGHRSTALVPHAYGLAKLS